MLLGLKIVGLITRCRPFWLRLQMEKLGQYYRIKSHNAALYKPEGRLLTKKSFVTKLCTLSPDPDANPDTVQGRGKVVAMARLILLPNPVDIPLEGSCSTNQKSWCRKMDRIDLGQVLRESAKAMTWRKRRKKPISPGESCRSLTDNPHSMNHFIELHWIYTIQKITIIGFLVHCIVKFQFG